MDNQSIINHAARGTHAMFVLLRSERNASLPPSWHLRHCCLAQQATAVHTAKHPFCKPWFHWTTGATRIMHHVCFS
jgi:hypothetical protein